jgi:HEPN domain-containing protein
VLANARFLLRHERWHSAVYLAGYALECWLKAAVCWAKGLTVLPPEYETHDLQWLLRSAGLQNEVRRTPALSRAFDCAVDLWQTEIRYAGKAYRRAEATQFFEALGRLVPWLERTMR